MLRFLVRTIQGCVLVFGASMALMAAPTITGMSLTSAAVTAKVTLTGSGFTGATAVNFTGAPGAAFTFVSDTSIKATVPSGATNGPITVVTPSGNANSPNLTIVPAPVITLQPLDLTVTEGQTATFTAAADNATSYLWQKKPYQGSFASIGVTTPNLTTPVLSLSDNKAMYCLGASGGGLTAYTRGATVTVVAAPVATSLAASSTTPLYGATVTLTPTFTNGTGTIGTTGTSSSDVSTSATSGTAITTGALTGPVTYTLTVTNAAGTKATTSVTVTPQSVSVAALSPQTPTVIINGTQTFSTTVSGATNTTVNWSVDGIAGGNSTVGTITSAGVYTAPSSAGTHTITATSAADATKSSSTTVTVVAGAVPTITTQPLSQSVMVGQTVTFTVVASGTGTLTYQWSKNSNDISGATSAYYTTPVATSGDNGASFRVKVANGYGTVTSFPAILTVTTVQSPTQPVITAPSAVTAAQSGYTASVPAQSGCTYAWTINGGTITAGSTTNQITFTPAMMGSMSVARSEHTATLLPNGKVFLAGGSDDSGSGLSSAELFDPSKNTFTAVTKSMVTARGGHTATLLSNGKVLLVGGYNNTGTVVNSAELFDPSTGNFSAVAGTMIAARTYHTATLLPNGKVLLAGGSDNDGNSLASAEIFDPSTNAFSGTSASMSSPRGFHTATLLPNGKVLLAGGFGVDADLATAEVFDPSTGTFRLVTNSMISPRSVHTATLLASGKVLLAGGYYGNGCAANADIYDSNSGVMTAAPNSMISSRAGHAATLLSNGQVLMVGGSDSNWTTLATAELFDPSTGVFTVIPSAMTLPKVGHTATLLKNGLVLLAGGSRNYDGSLEASAEFFDPTTNAFGNLALTCTVTNSAASVSGGRALLVVAAPLQPVITAPASVVTGQQGLASTQAQPAGCTLTWTIQNGTSVSGAETPNFTFAPNSGVTSLTLTCTASNAIGASRSSSKSVTVIPNFVTLTPAAVVVAPGGEVTITANQPVDWYADCPKKSSTSTTFTALMTDSLGQNSPVGTYYVLGRSKANGQWEGYAHITVHVAGSPLINSFSASPASVHAGQPVTLSWNVSDAAYVTFCEYMHYSVPIEPGRTSTVVYPGKKTTYMLLVSQDPISSFYWHSNDCAFVTGAGQVCAFVTVDADLVPAITSFSAAEPIVNEGGSTQLTAVFTNGTGRIDPGGGTVQSGVPVSVTPSGNTDYTLTVTNAYGATTTGVVRMKVVKAGHYSSTLSPMPSNTQDAGILLRDGRVYFRDGYFFDPEANTFSQGSVADSPVVLCPNGKLLIWGDAYYFEDSYQIIDPSTGTYSAGPICGSVGNCPSGIVRNKYSATLLADGRVLIAGGTTPGTGNGFYPPTESCLLVELESVSNPKPTFSPTGAMGTPRYCQAAIRLMDGRILVAGGFNSYMVPPTGGMFVENPLTSAEIYDPATGTWSAAGNLRDARNALAPFLLPDGRVLFNGAELFNPTTLTFSDVPLSLTSFESLGGAARLPNGLFHLKDVPNFTDSTSLYDPYNHAYFCTTPQGFTHSAGGVSLPDGTVLFARTNFTQDGNSYSTSDIRFDPQLSLVIQPSVGSTNVGVPLSLKTVGSDAQGVTWTSSGGVVISGDTFLAATPGTYCITATSLTGTRAMSWVEVYPAVQVAIDPVAYPGGKPWLHAGIPFQATARVLNTSDQRVTWSLQEGSIAGTITPGGLYTAASAGTWHIIATSMADPSKVAIYEVIVRAPISISIAPQNVSVPPGASLQFKVLEPSGDIHVQVTATGGTASVDNVVGIITYTAPTIPGPYTLTATSALDPSQSASTLITVLADAAPGIAILPNCAMTYPGWGTGLFEVTGTSAAGLNASTRVDCWISGPIETGNTSFVPIPWTGYSGSYLKNSFSAPVTPGTYTIKAVIHDNPSLSATAAIHVINAPSILSFKLSNQLICDGMPLTATWTVANATKVSFRDDNYLPLSGSLTFPYHRNPNTLDGTEKWTLDVYNQNGDPGYENASASVNTCQMGLDVAAAGPTVPVYVGSQVSLMSVVTAHGAWSLSPVDLGSHYHFDMGVTWSVPDGAITGSVNQSVTGTSTSSVAGVAYVDKATYVPAHAGTYTLKATANSDTSKSATVSITVIDVALDISPTSVTLDPGGKAYFGYSYNGPMDSSMVWSCSGGSIQGGVYTAPPKLGTYTVSVYSTAEPSLVRTATVTVSLPLVQISPSFVTMAYGGERQFQAVVRSGSVSWSVVENNGGSITTDGLYTAPQIAGTFTVKATSNLDSSVFATAKVVVSVNGGGGIGGPVTGNPGITGARVTVNPGSLQVDAGTYYPFSATVAGIEDQTVTWKVVGNPKDASIDAQGVFVASRHNSYQVQATSVADPTAIVVASVVVQSAFHHGDNPMVSMSGYTVTALDNGKVLVVGGCPLSQTDAPDDGRGHRNYTYSSSAWLYDPDTQKYTTTGNLITARGFHYAVKLSDGRVLIAGGSAQWIDPWFARPDGTHVLWAENYPFAEIYDPNSGIFTALPTPSQPHPAPPMDQQPIFFPDLTAPAGPGLMWSNHPFGAALRMINGKALIVGGDHHGWWSSMLGIANFSGSMGTSSIEGADLFDPTSQAFDVGTRSWRFNLGLVLGDWQVGAGVTPRMANLPDGHVLLTYGHVTDEGYGTFPSSGVPAMPTNRPLLIDSDSLSTSHTGPFQLSRFGHTLTQLADGRILAVGGQDYTTANFDEVTSNWIFQGTSTAEIYDPATNTWTMTAGHLNQARAFHSALLLPTGQVLIVGGFKKSLDGTLLYPNYLELYDPNTDAFSVFDKMDFGLTDPQLAMLKDGKVFLTGQMQAPMDPPQTSSGNSNGLMKSAAGNGPTPVVTSLSTAAGPVTTPTELTVTVRFDKYWPGQAQQFGSAPWTDRYQFDYSKRGGDWQNAEFEKVSIVELDARGNEVGEVASAFTDANGQAHFPFYDSAGNPSFLIQPTGKKYNVKAISEYEIKHSGNVWVKGVVYPMSPANPHESPAEPYQAPGAPLAAGSTPAGKNIKIDLVGTTVGGIANSGQRIAGVFNIVWMLNQSFNLLRGVEPGAASPTTINVLWSKDASPGSLFDNSSSPYLAKIDGNRTTNSDEYDDSVLGHEFGHFVNKLYGRDMSPGGFHDPANYLYDPCLAFSEGWAHFFQAVVRSQDSYCKSGGTKMVDPVWFDTRKTGVMTPFMNPDDPWPSDKFTSGRGWCNEFSVFRILWKMHKDPKIFNGDFSKSWALMKSFGTAEITDMAMWISKAKSTPGVDTAEVDMLLASEGFTNIPVFPYEDVLPVVLGNTIVGQRLLAINPVNNDATRQTTAYYLVTCDSSNAAGNNKMTLTTTDSLSSLDVRFWTEGWGNPLDATNLGGGKWGGIIAEPNKHVLIRLRNNGNTAINFTVKFETQN